ncbi:MAG TPA: JDVT-CTERM system CAAX-type protease [Thiotrichales bacterium]|nr:JDVT-CTERM system CAAX-type protease [Thiotrichales bacterium]
MNGHPEKLAGDPRFWAALGVAPLVWLLGWWLWQPQPRWDWPLAEPRVFLMVGLLYPLAEEILFRGLLQGELSRWRWGRAARGGVTGANLATSLIFTALHFFSHPPLAASLVIFPSLIFGYFRDRHGNIRASVILHMFYNTGYFWIFAS